jgi:5-methylcytosine-specific restriction endonuclease McrA
VFVAEWQDADMNFKTKICQLCGKEYQPTSGKQKYCVECGFLVSAAQCRANAAKWERENPEKARANAANWRLANPEKVKASHATWEKANPEKARTRGAKWAKENPEKRKASSKASSAKWYRLYPEKDAVKSNRRRAAKYANTPISELLTSTEWLAILAEANGRCAYCDKVAKLTLDHVIPLSRGGKHSKDNVVVACKHCNGSKGNKTLEEWVSSDMRTVDRVPPFRESGLLSLSTVPMQRDQHMELDTAVSQGADVGAIPIGSYNYTESGLNMTASSLIGSITLVQPPLSPVAI